MGLKPADFAISSDLTKPAKLSKAVINSEEDLYDIRSEEQKDQTALKQMIKKHMKVFKALF